MHLLQPGTFKFQSLGGAGHKAMNVFFEKCILISEFLAFLEIEVLGKVPR